MREKKILILGAKDFPSVACYDWGEGDLPNIADHDVVIINVISLTENLSIINFNILDNILNNIKSALLKFLDSKGTLYAMACPLKRVLALKTLRLPLKEETKENKSEIDNYQWSPIPLEVKNEEGDTVEIKDKSFEDYFKYVKKWYFTIKPAITSLPKDAFEDYDQDLIIANIETSNVIMVKIATDRRGRAIAAKFYYQRKIIARRTPSEAYESVIAQKSGDFILLPLPTEIDDREAINYVLEKCLRVFQKAPPPDWAIKFSVPRLDKIESKLQKIENKINALNKERSEYEKQKTELESYRELLYETGIPLQEIVRKVFTKLGYPPKPPKFGEEYIIEFNNTIGIIECKGVTKSISRRDFRQLLDYVKDYETEPDLSNIKVKGILIANAWRNLKPEDRETKDRTIFPAGGGGVIEIAKKHHMALLNTIDLFNIFCKFLDGTIEAKKILETIFKTEGIVKFPS